MYHFCSYKGILSRNGRDSKLNYKKAKLNNHHQHYRYCFAPRPGFTRPVGPTFSGFISFKRDQ